MISLMVPALGVGSSVLRVQDKTISDFGILPASRKNQLLIAVVNALLALAIALKGSGSLVNLIVSFYAVYLSAVLIPFIAYLLDYGGRYTFSITSVRLSLMMGSLSASCWLIVTFINSNLALFGSVELSIMAMGIGFGIFGLLIGQLIDRYFLLAQVEKEI